MRPNGRGARGIIRRSASRADVPQCRISSPSIPCGSLRPRFWSWSPRSRARSPERRAPDPRPGRLIGSASSLPPKSGLSRRCSNPRFSPGGPSSRFRISRTRRRLPRPSSPPVRTRRTIEPAHRKARRFWPASPGFPRTPSFRRIRSSPPAPITSSSRSTARSRSTRSPARTSFRRPPGSGFFRSSPPWARALCCPTTRRSPTTPTAGGGSSSTRPRTPPRNPGS